MIQKIKDKKLNTAGFTLIELIIVIAILGILSAIAIPRFSGFSISAKNRVDEANAKLLTKVAQAINANEGSFPATLDDLNKVGDYLNKEIEVQNSDSTFTYDNTTGIVSVINSSSGGISSDALLESLTLSTGTLSPAFSSSVTAYTVTLPYGTTTAPTVSATGKDGATVTSITQADTPNGTATVNVRSADGSETNSYTVTFTVLAPSQPNPPQIDDNGIHITVSGAETGALIKLYKDGSVIKQQQLTGSDTSHKFDHITQDNPGTYFATQTVNGIESTPSNTITISASPLIAESVYGSTNQFTLRFNKPIEKILTEPSGTSDSTIIGKDVRITGHSNFAENTVYSVTVRDKDGLVMTVNLKRTGSSNWFIQ
ncbi:prepilin-type N-terminal cleavage/methylation domain-containing protein [Anaerosolibacter carboniphilus]|uniref:Prepilin-type N-terminal cleavage/methylation domain-containing protein n=1 Tax=Anaerosolibacter carboniphilus TaxID=1417629 RepID=A0A841KX67_9FIRM|nr:prepilin-type N-terminal cleavage/methylation domain-containing protein [Anaerosolibacter carboniphilus]MBB6216600.1 prepilin-type N-terminal cleavage/methylation domain-containing protein [Anaerosolibacter carboniphilus]